MSKVVQDRQIIQDKILKEYFHLVDEARNQLCTRCKYRVQADALVVGVLCDKQLLPITSVGRQCPYFEFADNQVSL